MPSPTPIPTSPDAVYEAIQDGLIDDHPDTFQIKGGWSGAAGCADRAVGKNNVIKVTYFWAYSDGSWHLPQHYAMGDEQFWIWWGGEQWNYFTLSATQEWVESGSYEFEEAGAEYLIKHWELPIEAMWALGDVDLSSVSMVTRSGESLVLTATLTGSETDRFAIRWTGNVAGGQLVQPTRMNTTFTVDRITGALSSFNIETLWPLRHGDNRSINCRGYDLAGTSVDTPPDLAIPDTIRTRLAD